MKPEDRLLLICLRQNFTAGHVQAVCVLADSTPVDWERIALTSMQHGVSSLIFRNLTLCQAEGLDIPVEMVKKFKLSTYKNAIIKERQSERLIRALSFFHDRSLEVMLIKGAALDCCIYGNEDYVVSNDIDIIIHARREDFSKEKLEEIIIFFHNQGIEFEFFMHHDLDVNGLLPIDYESIWAHTEQAEYHGYPVLIMSATDLLLSLCINSSRKRYFRLKSLCDISETIQTKHDIPWEEVTKKARSFQCENIVFTALLVTSMTTGCKLPDGWEEHFDIHPFRQKLITTTVNYLIKRISFYPYPWTGISVTGRAMHMSLILPYLGYTRNQVAKKMAYAIRMHSN